MSVAGEARTVNERLIAEGYAEVFRGDGRGRLQPRLRAAERAARDARLGLWAGLPLAGLIGPGTRPGGPKAPRRYRSAVRRRR